jgi:polyhydroxyalkanoate synthesis regulator phasin
MPQTPDLTRFLDAGSEFVTVTRTQARARARELVSQGQLAQNQVQGFVDELMDRSRRRTDFVLDLVRQEIQRQVKVLGIATKDDLARLEAKLAKTAKVAKKSAKASAAKSGTKKSSKKSAATKAAAKRSLGKTSTKRSTESAARAS